jgi:DNA processing protein
MVWSIKQWLTMARVRNLGPTTFWALKEKKYTFEDFLQHIEKNTRLKMPSKEDIEEEITQCQKKSIHLISFDDHLYPPLLRHIPDPPLVLSALGNINLLKKEGVAVVGARNASLNGMQFAKKISFDLSPHFPIVSGFARGIDIYAHRGALANKDGMYKTIAVFAGGLHHIYPKEHTKDFHALLNEGGLVVSECGYPVPPTAQHFPKRNRIVSGISWGAVLVEAALKSGSLITARQALEQNRELMAVPGPPQDYRCFGNHRMIQQGAHLITDAEDVCAIYATHLDHVWPKIPKGEPLKRPHSSCVIDAPYDDAIPISSHEPFEHNIFQNKEEAEAEKEVLKMRVFTLR